MMKKINERPSKSQVIEKHKLKPRGGTVLYLLGWLNEGNRDFQTNTVGAHSTGHMGHDQSGALTWGGAGWRGAHEPFGMAIPET